MDMVRCPGCARLASPFFLCLCPLSCCSCLLVLLVLLHVSRNSTADWACWLLQWGPTKEAAEELKASNDVASIEAQFGKRIAFGTAGLSSLALQFVCLLKQRGARLLTRLPVSVHVSAFVCVCLCRVSLVAGLRGPMQTGWACMNDLIVIQASQVSSDLAK